MSDFPIGSFLFWRLIPRIASLTVATIGAYWLVERIFVV
jgi:hypothetical protein